MSSEDVRLSVTLSAAVLFLFTAFYNRIFAFTFDEAFASATGTDTGLCGMLPAVLTAVTVVLGMRMMGTLLISSSLIVFPSLTAMRVCRRFLSTVLLSGVLAVTCFFAGLVFSYRFAVPTGACIVIMNMILFLLFSLAERILTRTGREGSS